MDGEPTALFVAGDGVELEALWWHARPTRQPMPAVVLVHPWGDDAQSVSPASKALRDAGYHALAISMRGFGRSGGVDDCGLGQTNDLVAVLRWLAEQSEIDDDRIGVWGRSQGGMVALLAAARSGPLVRAVVAWNPVTDIDNWRRSSDTPGIAEYIDAVCTPDTRVRAAVDHASCTHVRSSRRTWDHRRPGISDLTA